MKRVSNSNIQPDPLDPNNFCRTCQRRYTTRVTFRNHLRFIHPTLKLEIKLSKSSLTTNLLKMEIDNGNLKNKKCSICERDYALRRNYLNHMKRYHKNGKREPVVERNNIKINPQFKPIWHNLNHYC